VRSQRVPGSCENGLTSLRLGRRPLPITIEEETELRLYFLTDALDGLVDDLPSTGDPEQSELLVVGSQPVALTRFPRARGLFRLGAGRSRSSMTKSPPSRPTRSSGPPIHARGRSSSRGYSPLVRVGCLTGARAANARCLAADALRAVCDGRAPGGGAISQRPRARGATPEPLSLARLCAPGYRKGVSSEPAPNA